MVEFARGGRTARTRQKAHEAVRSLFREGRDAITVREVSERSGIHEVTIYRRWGTIESLVLDVAVTQLIEETPVSQLGRPSPRLARLGERGGRTGEDARGLRLLPGAGHGTLRSVRQRRRHPGSRRCSLPPQTH